MVVLLPILLHYSFNPQGFGLLSIFEVLLNVSFFCVGLGSSFTVLMRKDLGAKRALVVFGMLVFLVSTLAFYNKITYIVVHSIHDLAYAIEFTLVNLSFIIAGARLLVSGLFYILKNRDFSLYN